MRCAKGGATPGATLGSHIGSRMTPKFQSFWFGDELPPYQRLAMKSFLDFGHDYILYAYRSFDVPAGVELRDAAEILRESRVFHYGARADVGQGSVAAFSNLFRYALLHREGGWWVDADLVCLSEDMPPGDAFMGWEYEDLVGNAVLKFPARHPFVAALSQAAEAAGTDLAWGETGPALVTRLAEEQNFLHTVRTQKFAYPVQSRDALHLLLPARRDEITERIAGKPFLHLWNEIFRRAVILPWIAPPSGSLVAELFERHGVSFASGRRYAADQIERSAANYYAATRASGRLDRTQMALDFAQALAIEPAREIKSMSDRLDLTQAALDATQVLALERQEEINRLERLLQRVR
jgi:hypothetical protein